MVFMRIRYNALFEYADDGINISFPDIPSAITCAYSRDHAIEMAKEVLSLVLHGNKRSELPKPTPKKQVEKRDKTEVVNIGISMEEKDDVLLGDGVIELTES